VEEHATCIFRKENYGGICVDVNGKLRTPGDFASMKVSQLDRILCDWKEKFTFLQGLNCCDVLYLQTAAILSLLAQPNMLERVLVSIFRRKKIKAVCSSRIVCKYSRVSFSHRVMFSNVRL